MPLSREEQLQILKKFEQLFEDFDLSEESTKIKRGPASKTNKAVDQKIINKVAEMLNAINDEVINLGSRASREDTVFLFSLFALKLKDKLQTNTQKTPVTYKSLYDELTKFHNVLLDEISEAEEKLPNKQNRTSDTENLNISGLFKEPAKSSAITWQLDKCEKDDKQIIESNKKYREEPEAKPDKPNTKKTSLLNKVFSTIRGHGPKSL